MTLNIGKVLDTLKAYYGPHEFNELNRRDPFKTLVACILSLRTKDAVTNEASRKLFKVVKNASDLSRIGRKRLERLIYPVGFYRTKALRLVEIGRYLIQRYGGKVPDTIEELLKLKGVGRKTANLVVSLGYDKPAICVDTHVHRISNRLGYVRTKDPLGTEMALRAKLPSKYWKTINYILVHHGQKTCLPVSPKCSVCPVSRLCRRVNINRQR